MYPTVVTISVDDVEQGKIEINSSYIGDDSIKIDLSSVKAHIKALNDKIERLEDDDWKDDWRCGQE